MCHAVVREETYEVTLNNVIVSYLAVNILTPTLVSLISFRSSQC